MHHNVCLCSRVKFVGLFVVVLAGLCTASDLWNLLGDLSLPLVGPLYKWCHYVRVTLSKLEKYLLCL